MKASTILISGATTLVLGTATAIPAENAIRNDVSRFNGKSFKEVYKGGTWNLRFFKADLALNVFVDNTNSDKANGLNGAIECGVDKSDAESSTPTKVWLWERTQEQFKSSINNLKDGESNDSKYLILVEFNKKGDWFNRGKSHAWFEIGPKFSSSSDNTGIDEIKKKLPNIWNSNGKELTEESFEFLESTGTSRSGGASEFYIHEKVLNSSLELPGIEKSKNCGKITIPKAHKKTV